MAAPKENTATATTASVSTDMDQWDTDIVVTTKSKDDFCSSKLSTLRKIEPPTKQQRKHFNYSPERNIRLEKIGNQPSNMYHIVRVNATNIL